MPNFKNRLISFMYGRNGADSIYKAALWLYLLLLIVNIFVRSAVISVLIWAVFVYAMFRFFSRDIAKRRHECECFDRLIQKVKRRFFMLRTILTDKQHSYRRCKSCKAYLRLPRRSGTHTAVCPKCGEHISVKIR